MKKLISIITILAIMLQVTSISSMAATAPANITLFTNLSEVYGAYTYDSGGYNRDVVVFTATDYAHFFRNMGTTKLIKDSEVITSSPKYVMSKDKKTVTATYTLKLPYFDIKLNNVTTFMKDKNGKVYFNDTYEDGKTYPNYKTYQSLEVCKADINSPNFTSVIEAEIDILNQIEGLNAEVAKLRKAYKDTDVISQTNLLDGFYKNEKNDVGINFDFSYDYNSSTYDDFLKIYEVNFYYNDKKYSFNAPYYLIEGKTASYMENDHYYIEVTANDRHHITKIKLVYNDEVIIDSSVDLTYYKTEE